MGRAARLKKARRAARKAQEGVPRSLGCPHLVYKGKDADGAHRWACPCREEGRRPPPPMPGWPYKHCNPYAKKRG